MLLAAAVFQPELPIRSPAGFVLAGEAGGTGPGPLCNPRPELSFEIFTIPGSEWEHFGWVFGMCFVMEMWDCAELCPVVTLGRAPQSCAGMTYL